jgi:putative peptidoglycan lipid II flippase
MRSRDVPDDRDDERAPEVRDLPPPMDESTGPIPAVTEEMNTPASEAAMMRSSAVMAVGTLASRVTGVLRDTVLTAALGLTIVRDAFALGNSLPNVIYILVVGGALNAVFVPQLVRRMKDDSDGGRAYANALLSATGTVLLVLTVSAVLLAPWIVSLYATNGYTAEQTALAVTFARYCLPQIFFYGLYTMLAQVLNARGHFAMPMFAPIANNVVAIATYTLYLVVVGGGPAQTGVLTPQETALLGIGTTAGVVVQALILIPVLVRTGYSFRYSRRWRGLGLTKAARLAGWTIGLVALNQIGFMVITRLATQANVSASEAGQGAVGLATYQTAYLIFILPHSVVTVSIVTALLPSLSRTVHSGRLREAAGEISRASRIIVLLVAPIAASLFLLGGPIASLLFGWGAADAEQTNHLGNTTQIFALAILPFTVYYVLLRGWYASEDTRTPFFLTMVLNVVNIAAALALFSLVTPGAQQVYGLALAFVIGYWFILVVAWPVLSRRMGGLQTRATVVTFSKVLLASLAAVGVQLLLPLQRYQAGDPKVTALWQCIQVSVIVLVVYVIAVALLRIPEARDLKALVADRIPGRRRAGGSRGPAADHADEDDGPGPTTGSGS